MRVPFLDVGATYVELKEELDEMLRQARRAFHEGPAAPGAP